jgi:hypothetical protein
MPGRPGKIGPTPLCYYQHLSLWSIGNNCLRGLVNLAAGETELGSQQLLQIMFIVSLLMAAGLVTSDDLFLVKTML